MLNIVLFGPPGSGKGTQSEKIIDTYGLVHLSTGDLLRKHLSEGTELGKIAKEYLDNGRLVPDKIVIEMVEDKIADHLDAEGFVFDGFPRTVNQAAALDEMLGNHNLSISGMIALDVPEDELRKRITERAKTSGRVDDQDDEKISTRIRVYTDESAPVVGYYRDQKKLSGVRGVGSIDSVFQDIRAAIDRIA